LQKKLDDCQSDLLFIKNNCLQNLKNNKVCEIGSGNGKLLIAMDLDGIVSKAIGIEISESRFNFAEKFRKQYQSKNVSFINDDLFKVSPLNNFDLIFGVDIVFQLLSALSEKAEKQTLDWIYDSLKPNGSILLELREFKSTLHVLDTQHDGINRTWEKFDQSDPFDFVLSKQYVNEQNYLVRENLFYKRNTFETSFFKILLKLYSPVKISALFLRHGFKHINIVKEYRDGPTYMITAQK
jgi:precorrin-6B methylase 2